MSSALRSFFLCALFAGIMTLQWNLSTDRVATNDIKNYAELAAHDAALALDQSEIVEGRIVFDQDEAERNFRESLQHHLRLDHQLDPLEHSFFQDQIEIKLLEFIDDSTPVTDGSTETITFPYLYENELYDIIDVLHGPSVVAVLETTSPRYFRGEGMPIRRAAVYEYVYE